MNSTQFTGNLGKDLEIKTTKDGKEIGDFSIFVKEYKKGDPNAGFWLNVTLFSPNSYLKDTLKKGNAVAVSGRLSITKYQDNYYTKILANAVDVFPRDSSGGGGAREESSKAQPVQDDLPF